MDYEDSKSVYTFYESTFIAVNWRCPLLWEIFYEKLTLPNYKTHTIENYIRQRNWFENFIWLLMNNFSCKYESNDAKLGENAQMKSTDTSSLKENLTVPSPQNVDDVENDSSRIIPKIWTYFKKSIFFDNE